MNTLTTWVKHHPYLAFVILACALSWWLTPLGIEGLPILPIGPFLAALIVVALAAGRKGLKAWGQTSFRWRVPWQWYAIAIAFPLVMNGTAATLNILLGATMSTDVWPATFMDWFGEAIFAFVLVAMGEELGFSGFALPQLLGRYSALAAAIILGLTRVLWHVPLILVGETAWHVALMLIPAQIVFTWIFIRGRRSAFLLILLHGAMATVAFDYITATFGGADRARMDWLLVAVYFVAGAIVLLRTNFLRSLSLAPDPFVEAEGPVVAVP